jgi:hypothetical protein
MPALRLGNTAPDFAAETTAGPIKFHDWIGDSWVYPPSLRYKYLAGGLTHRFGHRQFCSRTLETSPLYAQPSWVKSLGVQRISLPETSKLSAFLQTDCKVTTNGSRTSTNLEPRPALLTCNFLSCVVPQCSKCRKILICYNVDCWRG